MDPKTQDPKTLEPIWGKLVIFKHVAKGRQGPKGTPGMGYMSYNKIDQFKSFSYMIFKIGPFPH